MRAYEIAARAGLRNYFLSRSLRFG